jgi:hypothetical protein
VNRIVFQLGSAVAPDGMPFISISLAKPSVFGSYAMPFTCQATDPAFDGLRAAVVTQEATKLAGGRLAKLLDDVATRSDGAGQQPLDWAHMVVTVRDKLARIHEGMVLSRAAASTKEWTMPVVYVRPDPFQLQVQRAPEPSEDKRLPRHPLAVKHASKSRHSRRSSPRCRPIRPRT